MPYGRLFLSLRAKPENLERFLVLFHSSPDFPLLRAPIQKHMRANFYHFAGGFFLLPLLFLPVIGEAGSLLPFFNQLHTENGLSHNKVNCILQDRRGFVWMGTEDGLSRYDGKNFVTFNTCPGDSGGISGNIITGLVEDADGVLWIATADGGLTSYDHRLPAVRQFRQFKHRNSDAHSIPDDKITRLVTDDLGYLWMATGNHSVIRINRATGWCDQPVPNRGHKITTLCPDKRGMLWVGTADEGWLRINTHDLRDITVHDSAPVSVTGVFEDSRGNIWFGLPGRSLHCYAHLTGKEMVYQNGAGRKDAPEDAIGCFAEDGKGRIWMGGKYSGLYVYDRASDRFHHYWRDPLHEGSLVDNHVNCVTIDRRGIVWIGTNKGVSFYNPLFEPFVQTFLPPNGKDIASEKDIVVYDFYKEDATGCLWIATSNGLYVQKGDGLAVRRVASEKGLPPAVVRFCRDTVGKRKAMALAAVMGYQSIPDNELYDVRADGSGNFWISTYGGGLNFFDVHAKTFSHIPASSNLTEGIQTDDHGNVWMICNGHLHKYDPVSRTYSCYDLPSAKRSGINGYIYKDNRGDLYTAGINFYISFRPEAVEAINMSPKVWLTDFRLFDRSRAELLEEKEIFLRHDENMLSIEFSAPDFSGDNLQYSYQLEGADRGWVFSGKRNTAHYSRLSPGEYVFRVKATNWKGCDSNAVTMIRIVIRDPFWRSWWFYGLGSLLFALLCFGIYHYRIRELLKRQSIRNRIALDLHDNIGSTLSSISIYSQVARVYLEHKEGAQLRELLERMDRTASQAIDEMSDMVWAINPKNDDMRSIVARMETYASPLCAAKGIQFVFVHDPAVERLNLEMSRRKNLYFVYKEAVNNALKYSGCNLLKVGIMVENNILRLMVTDNGKGFDVNGGDHDKRSSLSGNGLANMRRRASEINAAFTINSQPGQGTVIDLSFRIYS